MKQFSKFHIFYLLITGIELCSCQQKPETKILLEKEKATTNSLLISHVNIFNGRDSVLAINHFVLIKDGIIQTISSEPIASNDDHTVNINGKGKTLMPGLIDAHVHLSGSGAVPWSNVKADIPYNLSAYLYAGITTVYDLGGISSSLEKVSQQVEREELIGPDIYHTHIPITVKNSHPIPLTQQMLPWPLKGMVNSISPTIDKTEEAPKIIKKYLDQDVDYVKIICDQIPPGSPEMSFEQLKALVDECHKNEHKAIVHIGSPTNALNAIWAGADALAHGIWRGELTEHQADEIAQSGVPIIYTIAGFSNVKNIHNGEFSPSEYDRILVPKNVLEPVTESAGKDVRAQEVMNDFFRDVNDKSLYWKKNFELLQSRKAPILVGTDSNLPGTYAGSTYFQEIETLKAFGLSNFRILTGATYNNAHLFLKNPNFGQISEGKKANLLLLNSNPLKNLDSVKNPHCIIKNGKVFYRQLQP